MKKRLLPILLSACMMASTVSAVYGETYEAEAQGANALTNMEIQTPESGGDYSGDGYVIGGGNSSITFTVNAEKAGSFEVANSYVNATGAEQPIMIYVNDKFVKSSTLPTTVSADTYAEHRETLTLEAGENTITYMVAAASTDAPVKIDKIVNGGFETGDLTGWTEWCGETYLKANGVDRSDAYEGNCKCYLFSDQVFQQSIHQEVTGLEDGTYKVTAWVKVSNTAPNACRMELKQYDKDNGDASTFVDIPFNEKYEQFEGTVNVTSGKLDIGFFVDANAYTSMQIDAVELWKINATGDYTATKELATGPLYWMAYESPFEQDHFLEEYRWDKNLEWLVNDGYVAAGYDMMSTDGWVEGAQEINENGYVTKYNAGWNKTWKGMADQLAAKGVKLGVYYDPLWVTAAAYNSDAKIVGTDIPVRSLINTEYGHFSNFKPQDIPAVDSISSQSWCKIGQPALYWLDADKPGAEEYVKGYVKFFADQGVSFLRVDFLGWYENGIGGDGMQNGKPAFGTARYAKALKWMSEACDQYGVTLSLVMPNQYNHAENELKYGDMMRVNEDVSNGGWDNSTHGPEPGWPNDHISGRRRGQWQPDWAQWGNTFDALTGWADVGGRGQMVLDADFLRMARFDVVQVDTTTERRLNTDEEWTVADAQKRSTVSLVAVSGSPICIADQYDTINENAPDGVDNGYYYKNEEILALNRTGLVAKPMGLGQSERWAGQLPDGSWIVALFNRDRDVKTQTVDFLDDLGIEGSASVRDLWQHKDLGKMSMYSVDLAACDSVVLKITPDKARYEAEVGSLRDGANSNVNHSNFSGWGFADKLEKKAGDVLIAVNAEAGAHDLHIRYCNGDETPATADLYVNDQFVQQLNLTKTGTWDTWGTLTVPGVAFSGSGEDLVDIKCTSENGFNLDYIEVGVKGNDPAEKIRLQYEAEWAAIGADAATNNNHQLASEGSFVDSLDSPHWEGNAKTVLFTVNAPVEGDYDLTFRYANGTGTDATADIFVDGKKLGYFTFPNVYTGAWDTWGEVVIFKAQEGGENIELDKVHLTAGSHTVEYKHGASAINLDYLALTLHEEEPTDVKVQSIRTEVVGGASTEIMTGDTVSLTATVLPDNAGNKAVTWVSSNENIAAVSSNGVVTGKAEGQASITAVAADGSGVESAPITVIVKEKTYTVRVTEHGYVKDGETGYKYQDQATAIAETSTDAGDFKCWKDKDGKIVCYASTYTFYVLGDTTLTPEYAKEEVQKEVIINCSAKYNAATDRIVFTGSRTVPVAVCPGKTVVGHGIVVTKDANIAASEENFRIGTQGVVNSAAKTTFGLVGTYNVNIKCASGTTCYGRAYVTYVDNATGQQVTKYSDLPAAQCTKP